MRNVWLILVPLLFIVPMLLISSGCAFDKQFAETVDALRDDSFEEGCVFDEIAARGGLGIYGQSGEMEGRIFKLKCSDELPDDFCFKYNNPTTGAEGQAGPGCNKDEPQEVIIVGPKQ